MSAGAPKAAGDSATFLLSSQTERQSASHLMKTRLLLLPGQEEGTRPKSCKLTAWQDARGACFWAAGAPLFTPGLDTQQ